MCIPEAGGTRLKDGGAQPPFWDTSISSLPLLGLQGSNESSPNALMAKALHSGGGGGRPKDGGAQPP